MSDLSFDDAMRALARGQEIYDQAYLAHSKGEIDEETWRLAQVTWHRQQRAFEKITGERIKTDEARSHAGLYIMLVQLLTSLLMLFALVVIPMTADIEDVWVTSWDTMVAVLYALIPVVIVMCALLASSVIAAVAPSPIRLRLPLLRSLLLAGVNMLLMGLIAFGLVPAVQAEDPVLISIFGIVIVSGGIGLTRLYQMLVISE